jgi:GntR family transcriptional regulator, transcriptional repressor for pyruvate dehydrogenase complex
MAKRAKATSLTAAAMQPIERRGLGQQVVSRILELVRTGNLRPGDRLPPERELIEIFRISRPSLRESLRALSVLGVIEPRHGGGAYVTDLEARTLLAPLDFFLSLSQSNLEDAFEGRRVIEVEIARKAAANARARDVAELKAMIAAHAAVLNDPIGFRILDSRFHERLSLIAGNAVLQRVAYGLYNLGLAIRRRATEEPGLIAQSTADHTRIVDAISRGEPHGAAEAMTAHLAHIEESTRRFATVAERARSFDASRRQRPRPADGEALHANAEIDKKIAVGRASAARSRLSRRAVKAHR